MLGQNPEALTSLFGKNKEVRKGIEILCQQGWIQDLRKEGELHIDSASARHF
jgi:hypothetical protein